MKMPIQINLYLINYKKKSSGLEGEEINEVT